MHMRQFTTPALAGALIDGPGYTAAISFAVVVTVTAAVILVPLRWTPATDAPLTGPTNIVKFEDTPPITALNQPPSKRKREGDRFGHGRRTLAHRTFHIPSIRPIRDGCSIPRNPSKSILMEFFRTKDYGMPLKHVYLNSWLKYRSI